MYHPAMSDLLVVLLVILVLVVIWRGPKTLPKLGQALGRGVREAKTEAAKAQDEIRARVGDTDAPTDDDQHPPA
jgi:Sec-independent protein translocase protein TatA